MESSLQSPSTGLRSAWRATDVVLLTLLWALLFVPGHGTREFQKEEGRKAIPAEEMLRSGDYVLPTVWGRPYLAKPPVLYWSIAATSARAGIVTPGSARLPSLLATLLTAWFVYWLGVSLSRAGALCAAGLFLTTPMVFEKGTMAEPEALFCLFTTLAIGLAWKASHGLRGARLLAGLALGLALLTKGPAALVFFLAALSLLAFTDRARARPILTVWSVSTVVGLLVAGAWVLLLSRRLEWSSLRSYWFAEVTGGELDAAGEYVAERSLYIVRFALGSLPALLLGAMAFTREGRRRWAESELLRLCVAVVALGILFFLFFPRSRARYAYPVLPWLALFSGHVLATTLEQGAAVATARVRDALVALLSAAAIFAGLVVATHTLLGTFPRFRVDTVGVLIGAALLLLGVKGGFLVARGRATASILCALSILALGRLFQTTQIQAAYAADEGCLARAMELESAFPEEGRVFTSVWNEFNTLAYVHRPIVYTSEPEDELEAGDVLILEAAERSSRTREPGWRTLRSITGEKVRKLLVMKRVSSTDREDSTP